MSEMLEPLRKMLPAGVSPDSREGIMAIQNALQEGMQGVETYQGEDLDEVFPLTHRFADGVYAREIFLPKGHIIIGKIHRYGHLNVISKGKVAVLTEFGVETYTAPCTFISKPGTKRIVGMLEDTVWTTFHGIHPGEEGDLEKIEDRIICKSYEEYDNLALLEA